MKQRVSNEKLSPAKGLLLIAALLAALILINYLLSVLSGVLGYGITSVAFWLIGGLIAFWMFKTYVLAYTYELTPDVLRISRSYGKRDRLMEDVYLSQLLFIGTPEEAQKRHPTAKKLRAVHRKCALAATAVVYQTTDGPRMLCLQANEALKEALIQRLRNK